MTEFARHSWDRALGALNAAEHLMEIDTNSAASRAYYAAFHAVTALFALRDVSFSKHSALRAAIHRDLVNKGEWNNDLGNDFNYLINLRETGDYGSGPSVNRAQAARAVQRAVQRAALILQAVQTAHPAVFPAK